MSSRDISIPYAPIVGEMGQGHSPDNCTFISMEMMMTTVTQVMISMQHQNLYGVFRMSVLSLQKTQNKTKHGYKRIEIKLDHFHSPHGLI